MTYPPTLQAKAITLAALTSSSKAARDLGIPHRTVNRWMANNSAELAAFVQQKRLEAAADAAEILPGLLQKLKDRAEKLLDNDAVQWNGTQLQAAATAIGILWTHVETSSGLTGGRFGSQQPGQPVPLDLSALDIPPTPESTTGISDSTPDNA